MIAERAADLIRFGEPELQGAYEWKSGQKPLVVDDNQWPVVQMIEEEEDASYYDARPMHRYNLTRQTPNYYHQLNGSLKKYNSTKRRPKPLLEPNWTYSEPVIGGGTRAAWGGPYQFGLLSGSNKR